MSSGGLSPRGRGHRGMGGELAGGSAEGVASSGAWPALRCDELAGARPGPGCPGVGDVMSWWGSAPPSPAGPNAGGAMSFWGLGPSPVGLSHLALWY